MTQTITLRNPARKRNLRQILSLCCCVLCLMVFMLSETTVAYCAEEDAGAGENATDQAASAISSAVNELATKIYQTMRTVISPLTILAFAVAGFYFLLGGAQGTEKARRTAVAAFMGLIIVIFAPVFGQAVASWFSGYGQGNLANYNPLD